MDGSSSGSSGPPREPEDGKRPPASRGDEDRRRSAQQVAHLFRISAQLLVAQDLDEQLRLVARGIVIACNYRRCVITLFDEDWHVWKRAYAGLTVEEAEELEDTPSISPETRRRVFNERYRIGNSYFIPHESDMGAQLSDVGVTTSRSESEFVDWHPEDFLFVPLRGKDEKVLGAISVDDPLDGLRPTPESLTILELFAREAAFAIEQSLLMRELSTTRGYLENVVTNSADAIVTTDPDGNIGLFNYGAERMFGWTEEEITGQSVVVLYPSPEEARANMKLLMEAEQDEAGRLHDHETKLVSKDGEEIPVAVSISALYGPEGEFLGTVGISRDLRPWKKLEQETLAAQKSSTVAELAATLCHEINNFLEEILSAGQISLLTLDMEEFRDMYGDAGKAKELEKEIERLKVISRETLKIAALTSELQKTADSGKEYMIKEYVGDIQMADLTPSGRSPGGRILIADDREYIREFLKDFLVLEGFEVETAEDGREALAKVDLQHYDLVLSDIKMPHKNGYEVFAGVRNKDPGTKVILMTAYGYDPSHSIVKASGEGLSAVLYKPFQMTSVRNAITRALAENGGNGDSGGKKGAGGKAGPGDTE